MMAGGTIASTNPTTGMNDTKKASTPQVIAKSTRSTSSSARLATAPMNAMSAVSRM